MDAVEAEMHPKQFSQLPLDGKVAYAKRRFVPQSANEIEPGTKVEIAGDVAPFKRDDPLTVACPLCGQGAGTACEGAPDFHRERRAAAPILVPGHKTGIVIGHEPHPWPDYPRKHMVQKPDGGVYSCNLDDLTVIE